MPIFIGSPNLICLLTELSLGRRDQQFVSDLSLFRHDLDKKQAPRATASIRWFVIVEAIGAL
jgi:hypothetical protein